MLLAVVIQDPGKRPSRQLDVFDLELFAARSLYLLLLKIEVNIVLYFIIEE